MRTQVRFVDCIEGLAQDMPITIAFGELYVSCALIINWHRLGVVRPIAPSLHNLALVRI